MSRTFKEIEYRLYAINRRQKIDQANRIALAGGKPKISIPKRRVSSSHEGTEVEISEKAKLSIEKAFNERQKQWQKS